MFLYPSESQEQLLSDLLKCRDQLARTCGFKTYAHRALNASTVEHPQMVREFIDELSKDLRPRAEADFRTMEKMKVSLRTYDKALILIFLFSKF